MYITIRFVSCVHDELSLVFKVVTSVKDSYSTDSKKYTTLNESPFRLLSRQTYWIYPAQERNDEKRRGHRRRACCWSFCSPCCCLLTGIFLALLLSGLAALLGILLITTEESTTFTSKGSFLFRLLFCLTFLFGINSGRHYQP